MRNARRLVAAMAAWAWSCAPEPPLAIAPPLTADEAHAIRMAEALLLANGYGAQPADRRALEFDAVERVYVQELGMPLEALLSARHNTVCFPAYGISRPGPPRHAWLVYFRPTRHPEEERQAGAPKEPVGHGVEVASDFSEAHVTHMDVRLRTAEKVLHPRLDDCPVRRRRTRG